MVDWMRIRCWCYHGIVPRWENTEEPDECRDCNGTGFVWLSENDRVAEYPGGRFRGSEPGEYARQLAAGRQPEDWRG